MLISQQSFLPFSSVTELPQNVTCNSRDYLNRLLFQAVKEQIQVQVDVDHDFSTNMSSY